MKEDLLGLNHWLSLSATCHTVRPRSSALSSGHLRIAPPKSSSGMPKCFRYHAASAALSPLLLKKTPPTPLIFAIVALILVILSIRVLRYWTVSLRSSSVIGTSRARDV